MNELQIFNSPEFGQLRTLTIDGEPWAVGKDVAVALGYAKPTDAVRKHVDTEDRGISKMETPSGEQDTVIINESGMYSLILSSKLPSAKRFKRWVTSEVLPALRKTGSYTIRGERLQTALTFDECMSAASLIASTCGPSGLPYVLNILRPHIPNIDAGEPPMHIIPSIGAAEPPVGVRTPTNEDWTADVKGAMHKYRISNTELASACGYCATYLSTVLHGKKQFESAESAEKTKTTILRALEGIINRRSGRSERDTTGEAANMINTAIDKYGMTIRGIARLTGLHPTQINRIRMGESKPVLERSRTICEALQSVFRQAD